MSKISDLLFFYRILDWRDRINGMRIFGYALFGYLMAGRFVFFPIFFSVIGVISGLMFLYSFHDYYDFKIKKEHNFLGSKIIEGKLNERKALIYCFLPLFLWIAPIIYAFETFPINKFIFLISLTIIIMILDVLYFFPPFRLKEKKFSGFPMLAVLSSRILSKVNMGASISEWFVMHPPPYGLPSPHFRPQGTGIFRHSLGENGGNKRGVNFERVFGAACVSVSGCLRRGKA